MENSETVEFIDPEFWEKAWRVYQGIRKLIWECNCFYIYRTVEQSIKEYGIKTTYVNEHGEIAVKLDDGTEYALIQNCPHLIYSLYKAKSDMENGKVDDNVVRKAKAYELFKPFFDWMSRYVDD